MDTLLPDTTAADTNVLENTSVMEQEAHLTQTFHEGVTLLSLSGPLEEVRTFGARGNSSVVVEQTLWHDFLDELSWLGDNECGGKTVTSIAAEASRKGTRFWVASNQRPQAKSLGHLQWILRELQKFVRTTNPSLEDVRRRIFNASIRSSFLKVDNYSRQLRAHIKESGMTEKKAKRSGEQKEFCIKCPDIC